MIWFHNFKGSVQELIREHLANGCTVRTILVSERIYQKCCQALGYEPDNILGYNLAVISFEFESDSGDEVMIEGAMLN